LASIAAPVAPAPERQDRDHGSHRITLRMRAMSTDGLPG
jgi:hypothetical protein